MKATTLPSPRRHELPGAYGPGNHDLLTAEQEVELGRLVVAGLGERRGAVDWSFDDLEPGTPGRQAAETLVLLNLRLVHSIARKSSTDGRYDDCVQDGTIGLMRAALKFDPEAGNKFSTYASWWIHQAISRGRYNDGDLVRLPVHMHEKAARVRKHMDETNTDLTRLAATMPNGLPELEVSAVELREVWAWSRPMGSLDDVAESSVTVLTSRTQSDPPALDEYAVDAILSAISRVDGRAADMVVRHFGLWGAESQTLEQVGNVYGITRERVRQLERRGLDAARSFMDGLSREDWTDLFAYQMGEAA